jgi:hypothetical protein
MTDDAQLTYLPWSEGLIQPSLNLIPGPGHPTRKDFLVTDLAAVSSHGTSWLNCEGSVVVCVAMNMVLSMNMVIEVGYLTMAPHRLAVTCSAVTCSTVTCSAVTCSAVCASDHIRPHYGRLCGVSLARSARIYGWTVSDECACEYIFTSNAYHTVERTSHSCTNASSLN